MNFRDEYLWEIPDEALTVFVFAHDRAAARDYMSEAGLSYSRCHIVTHPDNVRHCRITAPKKQLAGSWWNYMREISQVIAGESARTEWEEMIQKFIGDMKKK